MRLFYHLLANNLIAGIINYTIWFAITFFVYLETRSVFATAIIAGIFLVFTAGSGIWFGSIVDHHKKKYAMLGSSIASLIFYIICFIIYQAAGRDAFKDPANPMLWIFVLLLMMGVIVGNIRNIALPTIVTILFPPDKRDRANGLVGTTSGVGFLVTSVISGLLVGLSGMYHALLLAIGITIAAIIHLVMIRIPEKGVAHVTMPEDGSPAGTSAKDAGTVTVDSGKKGKIDLRGTLKVIGSVPGLFALIFFATFNNFLGGVFMSLMDAYGLSLVSVQVWGLLWGFLSTAFIVGGLIIAKFGLGKNPLRALFLANITIWIISCIFTLYPSIILLTAGMFIYLAVIPYIEAAEQTIIQKVVPHERQGRVFGFSQSMEQAASPLTAFLIGPIAQFIVIPFMTTGAGVELIGPWFGTGADRGMALIFTVTGLIGLTVTIIAMKSKYYNLLSRHYLKK
jgi:MFS transporter, DHA3 family, multidrug efflux protein